MSTIGDEHDQQDVVLDDLGQEMYTVDTRMDSVMKKIAKLIRMINNSMQADHDSQGPIFLIFLLTVS